MTINHQTLDNGLKYIYYKDSSNPIVSLQMYVRMGSNWELPEEAGFSHFTEHLVFKTTRKFPENSISAYASNLGANFNAYTEFDSTCFYLTLPSGFINQGLDILSELVMYAKFTQEDFDFEKSVVIEELKEYQNDPEEFFFEEIPKRYFKDSPYKNPIIGNIETLTGSTRSDLMNFYKKHYVPQNCFLIITGDIEPDTLHNQVSAIFADWKSGEINKPEHSMDVDVSDKENIFIQRKLRNDYLAIALPELDENHPGTHSLNIAMKSIAWGKKSRLYNKLYLEEKLITSIRLNSISGILPGITILLIYPKKSEYIPRIIELVLDEIDNLKKYGLTENELNQQKREILHSHRYSSEYIENVGMSLGSEELVDTYRNYMNYPDKISSVTRKDILHYVNEVYHDNNIQVFHMGPKKQQLYIRNKTQDIKAIYTGKKDHDEFRLSNGMSVFFRKVKGKPTLGLSLSLPVSSLLEEKGHKGINHLTSTSLLYGNKNRQYNQILDFCTSNGIVLGTSSSFETTSMNAKCFTEQLENALNIISEILVNPTFPIEHINNIRNSIISSLSRSKERPTSNALRLWKQMFFGKEGNLNNRKGTLTDLNRITRQQIFNWYKRYYIPSRIQFTIVGDFDFDEAKYLLERNFCDFTSSPQGSIEEITTRINTSTKKIRKTRTGMNQSIINTGGFSVDSGMRKENTGFYCLSYILGGDINSKLFQQLREKMGVAYSVSFDHTALTDMGFFHLYAAVDNKKEKQSLDAIYKLLTSAGNGLIIEEDLQIAKNAIRGNRLMEDESNLHQAQVISMLNTLGYGYQYYLDRDKRLQEIDLDFVKMLARQYLKIDNLTTHIYS